MTIGQLLRVNGAKVPPYVTIGGQTVFSGVTPTLAGFVHSGLGPVTAVAPHTFHGGSDPEPGAGSPWWVDEARIQRHTDAVSAAFPGFEYVAGSQEEAPCWVGKVDTGRGAFMVGVVMRRDEGLPVVRVLGRKRLGRQVGRSFVRSPHLYDSGALCVASQNDWQADEHTAATAIAWAAHWLAAYVEWYFTQKWPIEGFLPDAA